MTNLFDNLTVAAESIFFRACTFFYRYIFTGDFSGKTPPADGKINEAQFKNLMVLRKAMMRHGFKPLPEGWRHFTLANEPYSGFLFYASVQVI